MLISGNQLRDARALAKVDQQWVADCSGVSVDTIHDMESHGENPIAGGAATLRKVQAALESAGVEFTNWGQSGVRLKAVDLNWAIAAVGNRTPERTDADLLSAYLDKGPCVIFRAGGADNEKTLQEALTKAALLQQAGAAVNSILIIGLAQISSDQIQRLLAQPILYPPS